MLPPRCRSSLPAATDSQPVPPIQSPKVEIPSDGAKTPEVKAIPDLPTFAPSTDHPEAPATPVETPPIPKAPVGPAAPHFHPKPPDPPFDSGPDADKKIGHFDAATSQEIADKRKESEKTYRNADGTLTTRVYAHPVHFLDAGGKWMDFDGNFLDGSLVGGFGLDRYRPQASPLDFDLARTGNDAELAAIRVPAAPSGEVAAISYGLEGARPVHGVLGRASAEANASGVVTYPSILPEVDLSVTSGMDLIKEELVLHSRNAARQFRFPLQLTGLTASIDPVRGGRLHGPGRRGSCSNAPWLHG